MPLRQAGVIQGIEVYRVVSGVGLGDIVAGVMAFGPSALAAGAAAMSMIGWMKEVGVVTKLQTAAQWLFNIAMDANPIMLIVLGIAALVAAFIWLWSGA